MSARIFCRGWGQRIVGWVLEVGVAYEDGRRDVECVEVGADGVGVRAWVQYFVERDTLEDCSQSNRC